MPKEKYWYYVLKSPLGYFSGELATLLVFVLCLLLNIVLKFPVTDWIIAAIVAYIVTSVIDQRVSNNVVYSRYRHTVTMEIRCVWRYWKLDYFRDHEKVAQLLRKEFIEGFQTLYRKAQGKKIKVRTHKWVYDNVLCAPEVQNLYRVNIVGRGDKNNPEHWIITANNILSLMSPWYIYRNWDRVKEYAMKKRLGYQLELTPYVVGKRKLP